MTLSDAFRHSGGDEGTFWTEKKQNLEETLKGSFGDEDKVDFAENGFLEDDCRPVVNWSPKKERLLQRQRQGSPKLRAPRGDLRGWRSEKDVGRGGGGGGEPTHFDKNLCPKKPKPVFIF